MQSGEEGVVVLEERGSVGFPDRKGSLAERGDSIENLLK